MNPDDPQALESTLAAYRRLPQAEPAAALDAAIKAHARTAIAVRPRARWPVLFATAATVLLGASLGWRVWRSGSEQPEPLVPPSAPAQTRAKSEPEAAQAGRADTQESDSAAAADAPRRQVQERRAESRATEPPRPAPAPAPTGGLREAGQARDATASTPATPAPLADGIVAFPASARPPAATAPPAETPAAAPAGNVAAMESLAKSTVQPAIDTTAPADAASLDAQDGQRGHAEAAPSPRSPAAMGALRANPDAGASVGHDRLRRQADASATAESGLQAIRELQRQGRLDEARQALEAWQAEWPDATVPEELRALLQ